MLYLILEIDKKMTGKKRIKVVNKMMGEVTELFKQLNSHPQLEQHCNPNQSKTSTEKWTLLMGPAARNIFVIFT